MSDRFGAYRHLAFIESRIPLLDALYVFGRKAGWAITGTPRADTAARAEPLVPRPRRSRRPCSLREWPLGFQPHFHQGEGLNMSTARSSATDPAHDALLGNRRRSFRRPLHNLQTREGPCLTGAGISPSEKRHGPNEALKADEHPYHHGR